MKKRFNRLGKFAAVFLISTLVVLRLAYGADKLEERFRQFDTNHDGVLSGDELKAAPFLQKLDLNGDGKVTLEEARQVIGKLKGVALQKLIQETGEPEVVAPSGQPGILKASDVGVGRRVGGVVLQGEAGESVDFDKLTHGKVVLIALFQASCPISNKLGPELSRIEKEVADKGGLTLLLNVSADTKPEEERRFVTDYHLGSKVYHDPGQVLLRLLNARSTTEAFVLDRAQTLIYRGAMNDQYGLGYTKDAPQHHYVREALNAAQSDARPEIEATSAPGCALEVEGIQAGAGLTYHKDISRILQAHCLECHHEKGLGPFSLESYADVLEHASMIKKQVTRGAMPPWFAAKQEGHVWVNDPSLSAREKADLLTWLGGGRTEGDVSQGPVSRKFSEEWTIGKPDVVLEMPAAVQVKAEGTMPYQHSVIETSFPEERWVQAYEIVPSAKPVVHHVIVSMHEKEDKTLRTNAVAGFWAAYVPGNSSRVMPEGSAKRLPAGAKLSLQIHYTPNGKAVQDRIKIGLIFSKTPPRNEVKVTSLANVRLNIPPGAANHIETSQLVLPHNLLISGYMVHMHVRGKAFKYEVIPAGGQAEMLLDLPNYDFNWQLQYSYFQPKLIPAGSTLKATAVFDNSSGNPANPDPTKVVRWGEQTSDEMMIGYIEHIVALKASGFAAY